MPPPARSSEARGAQSPGPGGRGRRQRRPSALLLVVAGYTQPAQLPRAKYPAQFPRAKYIDTGPFKADDEWGSISGGHLVKAVRNAPPSVEVVDVDEPEGEGELVRVVATEICASDLKYLRWAAHRSQATSSPGFCRTLP